jgi:hypothetical protein
VSASPAAQGAASVTSDEALFVREVRKDGRAIVILRGVQNGSGVTVETEVYPVGTKPGSDPRRRPFAFATHEQAVRFVDDALDSLEYLGCTVVE